MNELRLQNDRLSAVLDESTGALVAFDDLLTGWSVLGEPELGESFRLLIPIDGRRNNVAVGIDQLPPQVERTDDAVEFTWPVIHSRHGGRHAIEVRMRYELEATELRIAVTIENNSRDVVENVFAPVLADLRAPGSTLRSMMYQYGTAKVRDLWPRFENTTGYYGVDWPTQLNDGPNVGAPGSPFALIQGEEAGLNVGVRSPSSELVAWLFELMPGYGDSIDSTVPASRTIGGRPVTVRSSAVHVPYIQPGETRELTPIALAPYRGDWHAGADIYTRWRDTWFTRELGPEWVREPHSWQQLQINSPEDELRMPFDRLVDVARECAAAGVTALQLVGWNDGGQDKNNPSHDAEPRLGGPDELTRAIAEIQKLGVKLVLFTKFTWADRATERFRSELVDLAVTDPYGDYYHYAGYKYETATQLLDINTRRLIPMCFLSERYLQLCEEEFDKVVAHGADGMLFDEALHHTPALLCFNESHGHRAGAPVYANDRELIRRLRGRTKTPGFLMAGEAVYDWEFEQYELSYHRSEDPHHIPFSRYLAPSAPIMTAVTGFDDRNMINQALLYRYVISYEPYNFKGLLSDFPQTVEYGRSMDAMRAELRTWVWDATFRDTIGASVHSTTPEHIRHSVFETSDGRHAVVVANFGTSAASVEVSTDEGASLRSRIVGEPGWRKGSAIDLGPRSAAVLIPDDA